MLSGKESLRQAREVGSGCEKKLWGTSHLSQGWVEGGPLDCSVIAPNHSPGRSE